MNRIILTGRLTKDIELRTNEGGTTRGNFTLAVPRIGAKEGLQQTDFFICRVWNKQAEKTAKYTQKGSLIAIEGELKADQYEDTEHNKRTFTYVNVQRVEFMSNSNQEQKEGEKEGQNENDPFKEFADEIEITEDDLPF